MAWLAVGAVALLAGCAAPDRQAGGPIAQAPTRAETPTGGVADLSGPVRVALLAPLTADDSGAATEARGLVDGARLAVAPGSGVTLDVRDTRGTPEGAVAAAQQALDAGAVLVIGPLLAANARAVADVAAPRGVNVIAFSNTPSAAGGAVWLAGQLTATEMDRIVAHAAAQGVRTVSVFGPDTPAGAVASASAQEAGARHGVRVAAVTAYPRSFDGIQDRAAAHAATHKAAGAQAVLLPDFGQGLQSAAAFMAFHGVSAREGMMLGLANWEDPGTLTENALLGGRFAAPDPERMAAFAARFKAANGQEPSRLAWIGYDAAAAAVQMLAAARAARDDTPFDAAAITAPSGFAGAAGPFRFTADGLNQRTLAVVEVARGGFVTLEPAVGFAGPGV